MPRRGRGDNVMHVNVYKTTERRYEYKYQNDNSYNSKTKSQKNVLNGLVQNVP